MASGATPSKNVKNAIGLTQFGAATAEFSLAPLAGRGEKICAGSAPPGQIIGEIGDLVRRHRLQRLGHGAVVTVPAVVLVLA